MTTNDFNAFSNSKSKRQTYGVILNNGRIYHVRCMGIYYTEAFYIFYDFIGEGDNEERIVKAYVPHSALIIDSQTMITQPV